jgi:hypothetical protein
VAGRRISRREFIVSAAGAAALALPAQKLLVSSSVAEENLRGGSARLVSLKVREMRPISPDRLTT